MIVLLSRNKRPSLAQFIQDQISKLEQISTPLVDKEVGGG